MRHVGPGEVDGMRWVGRRWLSPLGWGRWGRAGRGHPARLGNSRTWGSRVSRANWRGWTATRPPSRAGRERTSSLRPWMVFIRARMRCRDGPMRPGLPRLSLRILRVER